MQKNKRLRIFAGPNGSGKSTLFNEFKKQFNPGFFINADELEKQLNISGFIDIKPIVATSSQNDLTTFSTTKEATSLQAKAISEGKSIQLQIKECCIVPTNKITNSYEAAYAASFIRWLLYENNKSFSFETVMSHPSKIEELKNARQKGYKTYLYFVCTDSVQINVERVANRMEQGGHSVDKDKIVSRYNATLSNLFAAIQQADRAYLFDNSGKHLNLIAEVFNGSLQIKHDNLPQWFIDYVVVHYNN